MFGVLTIIIPSRIAIPPVILGTLGIAKIECATVEQGLIISNDRFGERVLDRIYYQ